MAERTRLKEDIVKDALKRLAWPPLYGHLVKTGLDAPVFDELLGHVRRSNDLILKRPDTKKDGRRRAFLNALAEHVLTQAGAPAADELRATIATLETVERGYQEILRARRDRRRGDASREPRRRRARPRRADLSRIAAEDRLRNAESI